MGKSSRQKMASKKSAKPVRKAKTNGRGTLNGRGAVHAKAPLRKPVPKPAAKKPVAKPAKRTPFVLSSIVLPENYRPSEDEPFMNGRHRAYFRNKLVAWKEEIVRQNRETLHVLHEDSAQHADLADRATSETDRALELRARDRQRKLIAKIDSALRRIEEGDYGYCEVTGEPIGIGRLTARPVATMTVEAQQAHERREKVSRDD